MKKKTTTSRRKFLKTTAAGTTGLMVNGIIKKSKAKDSSWYKGKQINKAIDNARVVCCYDQKIVKDGSTFGSTFSSQNSAIDTARVHFDLDEMAEKLAQLDDTAEAWKAIFRKPTTKTWDQVKVAFKVNGIHIGIMHHIAIIDKMCQVLNTIDNPGVPFSNMIIYDGCHDASGSSKYTPYIGNGLPSGVIVSVQNGSLGGSIPASIPDTSTKYDCTKQIADGTIDILINCALNKGHSAFMGSCTHTMKNHFGTFDPSPHNINYLFQINKSDAIVGGEFPRQQLCIIDSICGAVSGPTASITHMPYRIVMGTFGPAVDFLTVRKIRELLMNASHPSNTIDQFLTSFGYSSSEISDLLTLTPEQNNGKGWLEFTPGVTGTHQDNSSLLKKKVILFTTKGTNFNVVTKKISLKQGERVRSVSIFDIEGRVIRYLPSPSKDIRNENILTWDTRNQQGKTVSAGTYLLKISGINTEKVIKLNLHK